MKCYEMNVNAERTVRDGKAHWPDHATIYLTKDRAFDLVESLIRQIRDDHKEEVEFSFCGKVILVGGHNE